MQRVESLWGVFPEKYQEEKDFKMLKNFVEAVSSSQEIPHSSQQPVINFKAIAFQLHIMLSNLFMANSSIGVMMSG